MHCFFIVLIVAILSFPSLSMAVDKHYFAVKTVNVRDNHNGDVKSKLSRGLAVGAHQVSADWSLITPSDNNSLWIHSSLLCSAPSCYTVASPDIAPSSHTELKLNPVIRNHPDLSNLSSNPSFSKPHMHQGSGRTIHVQRIVFVSGHVGKNIA